MFEIITVKTFQGDEVKVVGNCHRVEVQWKEKTRRWETLYYKAIEDDGIELCLKTLLQEVSGFLFEKDSKFMSQAFLECEKQITV